MKTIFNTIKQIFIANKEYFIRCTLMSIITALIIGFAVGFAVPASAADDPTESDQVIIPAGTYTFNSDLTLWNANFGEEGFTLTVPYQVTLKMPINNYSSVATVIASGSSIEFDRFNQIWYTGTVNGISTTQKVYMQHIDEIEVIGWATSFLGIEETYFKLYLQNLFPDLTDSQYTAMSNVGSQCFGDSVKTVSLLEDATVPSAFGTWFIANTNGNSGGGVDPDPDPDPEEPTYTIDSGWYLWKEVMPNEFYPHTLTFNYRTFERAEGSGIPYYSYWGSMIFDNRIVEDTNDDVLYYSLLYYSSLLNGQVLVYDDLNGGWLNETDRRFYISSPLTVSGADYFVFIAYTDYYGETPPAFEGESVPSVPDDEGEAVGGLLGSFFSGIFNALDQFIFFAGFSLLDFITALLGLFALIWFLKLLAGG